MKMKMKVTTTITMVMMMVIMAGAAEVEKGATEVEKGSVEVETETVEENSLEALLKDASSFERMMIEFAMNPGYYLKALALVMSPLILIAFWASYELLKEVEGKSRKKEARCRKEAQGTTSVKRGGARRRLKK